MKPQHSVKPPSLPLGLLFLLHVYVRAAKLKAAAPPQLLNTRRYHPNHYG